jgi:hypothetical protein
LSYSSGIAVVVVGSVGCGRDGCRCAAVPFSCTSVIAVGLSWYFLFATVE